MTSPLDLEAVKRRAQWVEDGATWPKPEYPDRTNPDGVTFYRSARIETDALLDRRDLIAEVERLTAKLEDQNERIAQLHRERGEAVVEVGRLRAELERVQQPVKEASAAPGFNPSCDFCGRPRLQVPKLIRAKAGGPYICSHCVELCADILREEASK